MVSLLLALLFSLCTPAHAGACEGPEDCGIAEAVIPDFTLEDQNSGSASYGRTLSRDDVLGEILLIYWAQAT